MGNVLWCWAKFKIQQLLLCKLFEDSCIERDKQTKERRTDGRTNARTSIFWGLLHKKHLRVKDDKFYTNLVFSHAVGKHWPAENHRPVENIEKEANWCSKTGPKRETDFRKLTFSWTTKSYDCRQLDSRLVIKASEIKRVSSNGWSQGRSVTMLFTLETHLILKKNRFSDFEKTFKISC